MVQTSEQLVAELTRYASAQNAMVLQRFFKTGPGQYGEGDVFIGTKMGPVRQVAKQYKDLDLKELKKLLASKIHEYRMTALIIAVNQYKPAGQDYRQELYNFYIWGLDGGYINNWDLVDVTAEYIVGEYLKDNDKQPLYIMAKSESLWHKRVAIISTFAYIKRGEFTETLAIADILRGDKHDLIQKAVGWMLREVGKRVDEQVLRKYLDQHASQMPRTMLRYAIERLSPEDRRKYLRIA